MFMFCCIGSLTCAFHLAPSVKAVQVAPIFKGCCCVCHVCVFACGPGGSARALFSERKEIFEASTYLRGAAWPLEILETSHRDK